jgi:predicted HTH transcriptional regulator
MFCTMWGRTINLCPAWCRIAKCVAPHGADIRMSESDARAVARTPDDPEPDDVLEMMTVCEPYTVGELAEAADISRWTMQRRLEALQDRGAVAKKKHAENRVTWYVPQSE